MDTDFRTEFWASLALRYTPGVGPRTWKKLLEHYPSAFSAFQDAKNWARNGLARDKSVQGCLADDWRERAKIEWERSSAIQCTVLLWADPRFPKWLKEIPDPPIFLYCMGELSLLDTPGVAVVGTRASTQYGRDAATEICSGLSRAGVTVISGMAYGIDRHAHLAGLEGPGSSIGVLGTGLDIGYPAGNDDVRALMLDKGLLISELAPGSPPEPRNFPVRNRIISGLSLGTVVVEAQKKSGSMITARQAMEQNREVFAVPGPRTASKYAGCFDLIGQGAKLACTSDDVLKELAPLLKAIQGDAPSLPSLQDSPQSPLASVEQAPRPLLSSLSADEKAIVEVLQQSERTHIDDINQHLQWERGKLSQTLLVMEMSGIIQQWPGMLYSVR